MSRASTPVTMKLPRKNFRRERKFDHSISTLLSDINFSNQPFSPYQTLYSRLHSEKFRRRNMEIRSFDLQTMSQTSADAMFMNDIEKQLMELEAITNTEGGPELGLDLEPELKPRETSRHGNAEDRAKNENKPHEVNSQATATYTVHPLNSLGDKNKENVHVNNEVHMVGRKKLLSTKKFALPEQLEPKPLVTQALMSPVQENVNHNGTEDHHPNSPNEEEKDRGREDGNETTAPKMRQQQPKRNMTAFMHYLNMNRQAIIDKYPGMTNPEASRMIGQQWKQLPPHEKAHYEAIAAEDKARYLKEIAALGQDVVQTESESKGHSTPGANARGKAFQAFCMERQTSNDPKSSVKEQKKALITEWNALTPEQRAAYKGKVPPESKKSVVEGKKKRGRKSNAEKKIAKRNGATESSETEIKRRRSERTDVKEGASSSDTESDFNEDEDDDVDRENVDWEAHPAEAIISKTKTHYIVLRKGLPLNEFGTVPISLANSQRRECLNAVSSCPLNLSQVNEYENFIKTYKRDTLVCADGCELDLDNLPAGNLLESCSFLGLMRSPGHELHKPAGKDDVFMKVPLMATCRMVQRLLEVERNRNKRYLAMINHLQKKLKELRVEGTQKGDHDNSVRMDLILSGPEV